MHSLEAGMAGRARCARIHGMDRMQRGIQGMAGKGPLGLGRARDGMGELGLWSCGMWMRCVRVFKMRALPG